MAKQLSNRETATKSISSFTKREFEDFLKVTAVKSLQFAQHSSHWTESLFWIAVLLGATGFAIRDVQKVCEDFTNEKTYTTMRVIGLEKLIFESAIICIEYDPRSLNLADPQLVRHAEASKIGELAKRANTSEVDLLNRMLKLFTAISLIEHGRTADYQKKVDDLQRGDDLQQLLDWLRTQGVDIPDLRWVVGNWLCHSVHIHISSIKRGDPISAVNPCELAKISWLGAIPFSSSATSETAICVDIGGKLAFESMFDRVRITLGINSLFENLSGDYFVNAYVDFAGNPVSTALSKDFIAFPGSGCLAFEAGLGAKSLALDRRNSRCNPTAKTRFPCYADCDMMLNANTKRFNCTLLAWRYLYSDNRTMCFDVLTIQEQVDNRRFTQKTNFSGTCWTSCLFACEYRQYDLLLDPEGCYGSDPTAAPDRVSLELTPKRFRVPVFEEHFSPTLTDLLSRIGGTCGLWLGVGMLGICHALIFPLKLLLKIIVQLSYSRRADKTAVELSEHV